MKFLWLDMEMTGLEVDKERIIEVAAIVSDGKEFNEVETYHAIVYQDQKYIDAMDDWNKKQHGGSGLTQAIPNGKKEELVEKELIELINRHFTKNERPVLAGNSISQDRKFIERYMTKLDARLHYRLLDVTGFKVILENFYNQKYKKKESHRALDDIRESIGELKHYMNFISKAESAAAK